MSQVHQAQNNPYAQRLGEKVTADQVLRSRYVVYPIRVLETCVYTEGACALIFASPKMAREIARRTGQEPIWIIGVGAANEPYFVGRDINRFKVLHRIHSDYLATKKALRQADLYIDDIQVIELHDAFIPQLMITLAEMGVVDRGRANDLVEEGIIMPGGKFLINPSGGLSFGGHMVGGSNIMSTWSAMREMRARNCEECNFVEMHKEYVKDTGVMAASPVITLFAPSRFKDQVPFANGRVFLEDWGGRLTDTAMPIRAKTTTGSIRPGIYKKETKVKIVFANNREGSLLDIFALPQSELTLTQIQKTPLLESNLTWGEIPKLSSQAPTQETRKVLARIRSDFKKLGERIVQSPRAKENLANWKRAVEVRTPAGNVYFAINDGALTVRKAKPDLTLTVPDPEKLALWLRDSLDSDNPQSPPLTDFIMDGSMWLNKSELETITRLDRIPRSLRRDQI